MLFKKIALFTLAAVAVASPVITDEDIEGLDFADIEHSPEEPADIMKFKQMIHDKKCNILTKKCPQPQQKCNKVTKTVTKVHTKTVQAKQQQCKPTHYNKRPTKQYNKGSNKCGGKGNRC
ncbi:hypothetical protein B0I72DRAFT_19634 [Yarrowia lipolytica]|jgi:hypothetical protein|uniref:YALI0E31152p n=2 Tax=Yarrowia lipolytica TaxID=4952 RepID=Q6C3Z0_YARLI|nr:YALI0E31152p [Yarrowia lipolytica CLIB122]AOW06215.1 hypothetical protein YALI1_E36682g [Yarrowia lipolytica]KAB8285520.1 hypothetical protein BKA91DRAFT_35036 [Yarrowia lipolytica]KAE8175391.1 hypothetical protein BKA90DRAFT_999 [Yarrowia lipolytica]KAJ8057599.1 hypothetical protein LXG23DRAFT_54298 [Yarrowia lipolytica]QNP99814.1 Hypothetical protein YALI2_E01130g [Yarrowia lipolytica]|eukprot:XP_504622.2 YALI0E31152p [Yarrowia lipolytica CLIB122]